MFNFNRSKVKCPRVGAKVHVVKALLGAKDREGITGAELDVLSKAVDYIKELESEIVRLESIQNVVNVHVEAPKDTGEAVARGFLGRLFMGQQ